MQFFNHKLLIDDYMIKFVVEHEMLSKLHQEFLQIRKNAFLKVTLCKICILRKA